MTALDPARTREFEALARPAMRFQLWHDTLPSSPSLHGKGPSLRQFSGFLVRPDGTSWTSHLSIAALLGWPASNRLSGLTWVGLLNCRGGPPRPPKKQRQTLLPVGRCEVWAANAFESAQRPSDPNRGWSHPECGPRNPGFRSPPVRGPEATENELAPASGPLCRLLNARMFDERASGSERGRETVSHCAIGHQSLPKPSSSWPKSSPVTQLVKIWDGIEWVRLFTPVIR